MYPTLDSGNAGGLKSGYSWRNLCLRNSYNPATVALLLRMDATGEARPAAFDGHLNTLIQGLIDDGNYDTQFDVLVNTRGGIGIGAATSKLNYIKDAHNATGVNSPTYTAGMGYNSDGVTSYLNSNYKGNTVDNLLSLNSSFWGFKNSGIVGAGNRMHGTRDNALISGWLDSGIGYISNNSSGSILSSPAYLIGYNGYSRSDANNIQKLLGNNSTPLLLASSSLSSYNSFLLSNNISGTANFMTNITEILELYYFGKSITQAKFLALQSRFNTFYTAVC